MAAHTATLTVRGARLIKALNDQGRKAKGRRRPPAGQITSTSTIQLFTIQPNTPAGQCWLCFNGMWYQLC